jgi:hypothetical protein
MPQGVTQRVRSMKSTSFLSDINSRLSLPKQFIEAWKARKFWLLVSGSGL